PAGRAKSNGWAKSGSSAASSAKGPTTSSTLQSDTARLARTLLPFARWERSAGMWREGFLYRIDAEFIALVLCVAMGAAAWAGYRVALRSRATPLEPPSEIGPVEAAVTGLLALVLALSFNMAGQRFDTRQAVIVSQANAIGTAFRQCSALETNDRTYC